ncbi:MAG: (5-formylfuran-3-yl)methyl phosphate synthase, partial [Gemmataceae bacterium]|nr:(5-formylfuran-3-yl)methyl phosphate synthase [Gemmataceae bacterium]
MPIPQLLVSVRSATEAKAALAGGAALIDIKEPARGSLGRAEAAVMRRIVAVVAGRRPISAALGELAEGPPRLSVEGVCFAKLGLAGCSTSWRAALRRHRQRLKSSCCELVPVAYADWQRAQAPPPQQIADFAREENAPAWLIDTWCKDGSTLLDWLDLATLAELRDRATVPLALAGSLTWREMRRLLPVRPTWFAVRTAVCRG